MKNKYSRLTLISEVGVKDGFLLWRMRCDCGKVKILRKNNVENGRTRSCGCLNKETVARRNFKHGLADTPTHRIWRGMKDRCARSFHKNYHSYGGRGIKVCRRWMDFTKFLADMGERPSPEHTIERINNNKGYSKSNCAWILAKHQNRNTCRTKLNPEKVREIRANRKKLSRKELSARYGVSKSTIRHVLEWVTWADVY